MLELPCPRHSVKEFSKNNKCPFDIGDKVVLVNDYDYYARIPLGTVVEIEKISLGDGFISGHTEDKNRFLLGSFWARFVLASLPYDPKQQKDEDDDV